MLDPNVEGTTGTRSSRSPEAPSGVEIPFPLDFVPSAVTLTARGDAAVAVIRLKRQLLRLAVVDRAYIVEMLRDVVREVGHVQP